MFTYLMGHQAVKRVKTRKLEGLWHSCQQHSLLFIKPMCILVKDWKKIQNILGHFSGKRWEKCRTIKIGHS